MKKVVPISLFIVTVLFGDGVSALAVFNTPLPKESIIKKRDCWVVCKKRVAKVRKLQKALEFYKKSPYYSFSASPSFSTKKRLR